jgi:hypothetical protein
MSGKKHEMWCECCVFYDAREGGVCRRRAPRPLISPREEVFVTAWWPLVDRKDWCGEFTAREEDEDGG